MSKITKETGKTLASEIIKDLEKEARNKDTVSMWLKYFHTGKSERVTSIPRQDIRAWKLHRQNGKNPVWAKLFV